MTLLAWGVFLLVVPRTLHAQSSANDYQERIGRPDFSVSQPVDSGTVNISNGNLRLEIPMGSFSQRGGKQLSLKLTYDSKIYQYFPGASIWLPQNVYGSDGGWQVTIANSQISGTSCTTYAPGGNPECYGETYRFSQDICDAGAYGTGTISYYDNFALSLPDGTSKVFGATTIMSDPISQTWCSTPDTPNATGLATDGSGWSVSVTNYTNAVVYDNQGNVVSGPGQTDANGNEVSWDQNGNLVDELGRTLVVKTTNGNIVYYDVLNSQGTRSRYTVTKTTINANTAFGMPYATEYNGTITVVQSLTLPNLTSYTFTYDSGTTAGNYGILKTMTLPTGGQIQYGYATFADSQCSYTRWLTSINSAGNTWSYAPTVLTQGQHCPPFPNTHGDGLQQVALTKPNGASAVYTFDIPPYYGAWNTTSVYRDSLGNVVENQLKEYISSGISQLPSRLTTSIPVGGSTLSKKVEYSYEAPGNLSEVREWDYYTGTAPSTPTRITDATYTAANSAYVAAYILGKPTTILVKSSSGTVVAQTQFEYDNYTAGLTPSGAVHHNSMFNTSHTIRGNVTAVQKWRNTDGAWLTTRYQYDDAGNVLQASDPMSHVTQYAYADSWGQSTCAPSGGNAAAYQSSMTNALNQTLHKTFNSCSGTLSSITDLNGKTTNFAYDAMDRLIQSLLPPDGNNQRGETDISYNDPALPATVTTTSKITSSLSRVSAVVLDSFGRTSQTRLTDSEGMDVVDTTYDSLGRVATVSNPYRSTSDSTYGITTYKYDALNHPCVVTPPDATPPTGTTCPTTQPSNSVFTTYAGNTVTVTDQAGKSRKSVTDGLGRLTQVFEDPSGLNYETDYSYDLLDNLLTVNQKGGSANSANWRTRTFTYNSLSQLLTASNPESGTNTYTYDNNGNLLTKVAPAPNQTGSAAVTTTFQYDALNRVTQKSFSDGATPTVKYGYDAVAPSGCSPPALAIGNGIGRRTSMCDAAGAEAWSYDTMGRPLADQRTTNAVTKATTYTYNLDGSVATISYPSGRTITYTLASSGSNTAGRISSAVDSIGPINYVAAALYSPPGALSSFTNGASIVSTYFYNNRLQPCRISVKNTGTAPASCTYPATGNILDLSYSFNLGAADNGNLTAITNNRDNTRSQNFSYDFLNRISTAQTQTTGVTIPNPNCWGLTFGYDPWGNLLQSSITGPPGCSEPIPLNVAVTTSNRISTNTVAGVVTNYCYDAPGNLIHIVTAPSTCPTSGPYQYAYNAENQLTSTAGVTYTYDGDGKRVQKSNVKLYWYGIGSDPLDETDLLGNTNNSSFNEYIFFDGKRIARRDSANAVNYYFADHLGTARLVTNASGTILDDSDFYPFGGERPITSSSGNPYKFTGKERDAESGLDNFDFRYNSSSLGRFMSPDPVGGYISNPQSLNRYTYVLNNPLNLVDPFGLQDSFRACISSDGPFCNLPVTIPPPSALIPPPPASAPPSTDLPGASGPPSGNQGAGVGFSGPSRMDSAQLGLGLLGAIPGPIGTGANLINAGISLYRGNYGQAALNAAFAIPFVGMIGELGKVGELGAGIIKNTERIESLTGTAAFRIPDELNRAEKIIGEVKNVNYQAYTRQIRDYAAYAQKYGYEFRMHIRQGTRLSAPLMDAIEDGFVTLVRDLP